MVDPKEVTKAFTPFPISLEMRRTVSEMIQPGLTGQLQKIQMESAALMYITLVARALEQEPPPANVVSNAERDAAVAIFERLSTSLQEPLTLSELAAETGISEKRLNWVFREIYGGTVFEVLRDARLKIAREMLETVDAPIKTVAWDVGYAHVSNFNRAFSKMFGVTPGAVARTNK